MPITHQPCINLSASAIAAFKACPTRFRLGYIEGLRPDRDTDSQRVGTNWHALHELYAAVLADTSDKDRAMAAVVSYLSEQYSDIPAYKTAEEWALEQQILLTSFVGYVWYWQNDPLVILHSELSFDLPVVAPKVNLSLPTVEVRRLGRIDHLAVWQGRIGNVERKSTSRSIDTASDYWVTAKKNTQISMYALACRDLARTNQLPETVVRAAEFDPRRFGNTIYDVWHKPTIRPAKLTQAEMANLVKTGTYHNTSFAVDIRPSPTSGDPDRVWVDNTEAEVILGKKTNTIRETARMFGARLLVDITTRPEFYFCRREIPRSDADLSRFEIELFNIYQTMRLFHREGCWFENEQQCRATFPCPYISICHGPGADAVCDGSTVPPNFTRSLTTAQGAIYAEQAPDPADYQADD